MATPPRYKSGPKKGQFKPRKAKKAKKAKKAIKRKLGARRKKGTMAKKKRKRGSRRRGASTSKLMTRAKVAGWTSVYGYLKEQRNTFANVPKLDAVGQDATMMVAAHLLAKHGPRITRSPLDHLATGLSGVVGYRLGASGYKLSSIQGMDGVGYTNSSDLVGELNPNDFLAEDLPDEAV